MNRYYFDFVEGMKRSTDTEGLEFASPLIANREATATLGHLAKEALCKMQGPYDAAVEVRDAEGTLLYQASFSFRPSRMARTRRTMAQRESRRSSGISREPRD